MSTGDTMTITVFGGSGAIGGFLVKHALDKGYIVKTYVRNPAKIAFAHPNLEIIKGKLDDYVGIYTAISGADAVISTLGVPMKRYEGHAVLDGHINIIKAMKEQSISRFITLATPSVKFEKDKASFATVVPSIIAGLFLKQAKDEIVEVGKVVTASDLDWTIVRILAPKDTAFTGKVKVTFGNQKIGFAVSREDIAAFMLKQVTDNTYIRSMPIIGS
jgi:putative NADH-flavin reductase